MSRGRIGDGRQRGELYSVRLGRVPFPHECARLARVDTVAEVLQLMKPDCKVRRR
jgi:hypothetical protein